MHYSVILYKKDSFSDVEVHQVLLNTYGISERTARCGRDMVFEELQAFLTEDAYESQEKLTRSSGET